MSTAKPRPRPWVPLLGLCLALGAAGAQAVQTCKYDSIPATAPASRFTDNGNGTVTDKTTGLQWQRCSQGQTWSGGTCAGTATAHTWQAALQLADVATYAGKSDWRLPNIKELASIVEQACYSPAIDLAVFPGTPSSYFWSSSPFADVADAAWFVDFSSGLVNPNYMYYAEYVRLVRGGQ